MATLSPLKSPAHMELKSRFAQTGGSVDHLRSLLWLINAHDQLVSFPQICENLASILSTLATVWNTPLADWGLEEWPPILQWVIDSREELGAAIGGLFDLRPKDPGDNTVIGRGSVRYPLYAVLLNRHQNRHQAQNYRLLQAHLLVAQVLTLRKFSHRDTYENHEGASEWNGSPNSIYSAALAVRQLSEERNASLQKLFSSYRVELLPTAFAEQILQQKPQGTKQVRNRHSALAKFLGKAADLLGWRRQRKGRSHGAGTGGKPWLKGYVGMGGTVQEWPLAGDPDDPHDQLGRPFEIRRTRHSKNNRRRLLSVDDHPWEDQRPGDLFLVDPFAGEEERENLNPDRMRRHPGERSRIARAQVAHVAMANQLLRWAPQVLTIDELTELLEQSLRYVETLPPNPADWNTAEINRLETIALLHTMLGTSSELERASDLRILSAERSEEEFDLALLPQASDRVSLPVAPLWRVRALRVRYASEQHLPNADERVLQNYVFFPDETGGSYFVHRFLAARAARRTKAVEEASRRNKVFRGSPQALTLYRERLKKLLSEFDPTGRLTTTKVANWLFLRVIATTGGDVALASVLTARTHSLAHVRSYYNTPSLSLLRDTYCQAVSRPLALVRGLLSCPVPEEFVSPPIVARSPPDMRYVGSRRCPTQEALVRANQALRKKVRTLPVDRTDIETRAAYHNYYSLYTIAFFNYSTGMRGIVTPYLSLSEVDGDSGYTKILDKGDRSGYKTRLLWIPPQTLRQMRHYEDHLAFIRTTLRSKTASPVVERSCFFLRPDGTPVDVRPRTILPLMHEFLPFPANVHRRFVRSELQARQCSPEVIDSWMGHWYRGEEPWGTYSSFLYRECCQSLKDYLVPLLAELGFGPVRSRLA